MTPQERELLAMAIYIDLGRSRQFLPPWTEQSISVRNAFRRMAEAVDAEARQLTVRLP